MTTYLIKNHDGLLLGKDLEWVTDNTSAVYHSPFKDVALNQLIELNARDIQLRASVISCATDAKGRPVLLQETAA